MRSHRLEVLIPPLLDVQVRQAAERRRLSKGEWVRRAIEKALDEPDTNVDPLAKLRRLLAPTAGIRRMPAEIQAARD